MSAFDTELLGTLNTALSLVTALAAIGWGILMLRLKNEFASRASLATLETRVAGVEAQLRLLPGHETVRDLTAKVGDLHSELASVAATLDGMKTSLAAIGRQWEMVQEHLLTRPR